MRRSASSRSRAAFTSTPPRAPPLGPAFTRTTSSSRVDNVEVTSAKQFEASIAKLDKAKPVTLLVRQGDVGQVRDRQAAQVERCTLSLRPLTFCRPQARVGVPDAPIRALRRPRSGVRARSRNCPQDVHRHLWITCG